MPEPMLYEASKLSGNQVLGLSHCPGCGLYFTRPRLADHNVQTQKASYDAVRRKYLAHAERGLFHKDRNYRLYLRLAESHLRRSGVDGPYSLLDIGAHCGFFLRRAKEQGWTVAGVEPSAAHARFARDVNGTAPIEDGYFDTESLPGRRFHLIAMLDVLEHIPNPVEVLAAARTKLHPGGLVLAKVPHLGFYRFWRKPVRWLGRLGMLPFFPTFDTKPPPELRDAPRAGFFDLFEHVVHYESSTAKSIFARAGLDHVEQRPAPPTNPPGDPLNLPRSIVYGTGARSSCHKPRTRKPHPWLADPGLERQRRSIHSGSC